LENSFVISSQKGRLWDLVMGVELKPQNIVATDGTITDPPATGLGSISNLGGQR
jgi:hypothetical protein